MHLTYLHPKLYKNNSSVSVNFLPGHVNRHSKQLIYENNIFNSFKKLLTIFNSYVDYSFIFNHSFDFNATYDEHLEIPQFLLALYSELIIVLTKLTNVVFDSFDYQKLWKTVALMVYFNSFNSS